MVRAYKKKSAGQSLCFSGEALTYFISIWLMLPRESWAPQSEGLERSSQVKGFIYKALQLLFDTFASFQSKKFTAPLGLVHPKKNITKRSNLLQEKGKKMPYFGFSNINWVGKVARSILNFDFWFILSKWLIYTLHSFYVLKVFCKFFNVILNTLMTQLHISFFCTEYVPIMVS